MKNYIFIILLSFLFVGCEDYLDKTDPTATKFDEFYNDEGDLQRVIYSSYRDVFTHNSNRRTLFYMEDGKSDNAYSRSEGDHHQKIANGSFNTTTTAFEYYYTLHMKHLGRLNTFIAKADVPYIEDESVREEYTYVLKALRYWHYFHLTFRWGDVPFTLKPADLDDARKPAVPKEEILETLFSGFQEISDGLSPVEYTTDKYMFNQWSFKGLVMRYALYNERYELAARLAKEIMDSGQYSLHPDYGALFQYGADSNNNEFIMWEDMASHSGGTYSFRDLGPHFRTGPGASYLVPLKSLVDSYWTLQGDKISESPQHSKEEYELNPGLNRDPRYSASIIGNNDEFYGETIDVYNPNSPMYYEKERGSASGYWFKKFVDESDAFKGADAGNMDFPLMRYAEILLTYAEAKIMLGDIDNLTKQNINEVRARAGLDMTEADVTLPKYSSYSQSQWVDLIRNERRIEFAAEGLRYNDIIRWRTAEDVLNQPALGDTRKVNGELNSIKVESRSFQEKNYLWPFHESVLRVNPGLKQNPGY